MCYRCEICQEKVEAGKPQFKWPLYRANKSIRREIAVCSECIGYLKIESLPAVIGRRGRMPTSKRVILPGREPGTIRPAVKAVPVALKPIPLPPAPYVPKPVKIGGVKIVARK